MFKHTISFILVLLAATFSSSNAQDVQILEKQLTKNRWYGSQKDYTQKVNDSTFLLMQYGVGGSVIQKYNDRLELIYEINLNDNGGSYVPSYEYVEKEDAIYVFHKDEQKKTFTLKAEVYSVVDGKLIFKKDLYEGKEKPEIWLDNSNMYFFLAREEEKNSLRFSMYDLQLKEINNQVIEIESKPYELSTITANYKGELYAIYNNNDTNNLKIEQLSQNGDRKEFSVDCDFEGLDYKNVNAFMFDSDRLLIISHLRGKKSSFQYYLQYLNVHNGEYETVKSDYFDEDYILSLFGEVSEQDIARGKVKPKKKLGGLMDPQVMATDDGSIYFLIEESGITGYRRYANIHYSNIAIYEAESILLMKFDAVGNSWNRIVQRDEALKQDRGSTDLNYKNLKARFFLADDNIYLFTPEREGSTGRLYVRRLNAKTGKLFETFPLKENCYITNSFYTLLLNEHNFIFMSSNRCFLVSGYILNSVTF